MGPRGNALSPLARHLARRFSGPAAEGVRERTDFLVAQQPRHLGDRQAFVDAGSGAPGPGAAGPAAARTSGPLRRDGAQRCARLRPNSAAMCAARALPCGNSGTSAFSTRAANEPAARRWRDSACSQTSTSKRLRYGSALTTRSSPSSRANRISSARRAVFHLAAHEARERARDPCARLVSQAHADRFQLPAGDLPAHAHQRRQPEFDLVPIVLPLARRE